MYLRLNDSSCWGFPPKITINNFVGNPYGGGCCGFGGFRCFNIFSGMDTYCNYDYMNTMAKYSLIGSMFNRGINAITEALKPGSTAQAQPPMQQQYTSPFVPYTYMQNPANLFGFGSVDGRGGYYNFSTSAANNSDGVAKDAQNLAYLNKVYSDNCDIIGPSGDGSYTIIDKKTKEKFPMEDLDAVKAYLENNEAYNKKTKEVKDKDALETVPTAEAPKTEAPKTEAPKAEVPKSEAPENTVKPDAKEAVDKKVNAEEPEKTDKSDVTAADNASVAKADDNKKASDKPAHKGIKLPAGWYRASNDNNSLVKEMIETKGGTRRQGQLAADYVVGVVLKSKNINGASINRVRLMNDIAKYNPSLFDANGNYKPNADYSKLDIPARDYILKNYQLSSNKTTNQTKAAESKRPGDRSYKVSIGVIDEQIRKDLNNFAKGYLGSNSRVKEFSAIYDGKNTLVITVYYKGGKWKGDKSVRYQVTPNGTFNINLADICKNLVK